MLGGKQFLYFLANWLAMCKHVGVNNIIVAAIIIIVIIACVYTFSLQA